MISSGRSAGNNSFCRRIKSLLTYPNPVLWRRCNKLLSRKSKNGWKINVLPSHGFELLQNQLQFRDQKTLRLLWLAVTHSYLTHSLISSSSSPPLPSLYISVSISIFISLCPLYIGLELFPDLRKTWEQVKTKCGIQRHSEKNQQQAKTDWKILWDIKQKNKKLCLCL